MVTAVIPASTGENCGKTVEIESPSESWLKGISDKYGFTIERHTLEVFGLCEDCRKADK